MKSKTMFLENLLKLAKLRISISITITALVGYILYINELDIRLLYLFVSVLILTIGSASLNQYQEFDTDALMKRTAKRPIVVGNISPYLALTVSVTEIGLGTFLLAYFFDMATAYVGLSAVITYNVIYTPLKKITLLSVIAGAVVGAIPPYIGWVAAGGTLDSIYMLKIAFFLFMWQMPHFWILNILYEKEYKNAGLITLTRWLNEHQMIRVTYFWILILVFSSLFLWGNLNIYFFINLIYGVYLLYQSLLIFNQKTEHLRKTFMRINIFVLFILLLLILEKYI